MDFATVHEEIDSFFESTSPFKDSAKIINKLNQFIQFDSSSDAWIGDDPCGDGDLPHWSGVTCSTQGDYRVVTELYVSYLLCILFLLNMLISEKDVFLLHKRHLMNNANAFCY
ncbi:hypothetical protein PVK06_026846 [Gossypium arboreum]|uniref:Leucine-rich repeat-containing N-terminal plant-type domain-containing protein n=1 Tax=Gossypium arboreum TaxID=29729 RepID=A0ABR0NYU3_GOSAR|nr:hypothetical protein PVK06_026846 [Gossypium arboreum]